MHLLLAFLYDLLDKINSLEWLLENQDIRSSDNQYKG